MTNVKTKHAMNSLTKVIIFFTVTLLFLSCSKERSRLEYALQMAGENRNELEKVLEHYENDSLKLKAAIFLIENMPHYYSYEGAVLDSMKAALATGDWRGVMKPEVKNKWNGYSYKELPKVYDVEIITTEYLIKNIDFAFDSWKNRPWGKYIGFDDFCEYILPYRIDNEPLEEWREAYCEEYACLLDSVDRKNDIIEVANILMKRLTIEGFPYNSDFNLPHLGALYNLHHHIGRCQDSCDFLVYLFRALGMPIAIDFYVYSPESLTGHSWVAVKDTTGEFIPFSYNEVIRRGNKVLDGRKMGKAFRLCYGIQPELYPGISKDTKVPPFFKHRYKKDITEYYSQNSIQIDLEHSSEKYLYMGVFKDRGWIGIDMTQINSGKAIFHNLEPEVVYEPLNYDGKRYLPAGFPIYIERNGIKELIPDTIHKEQVKLVRKYPYFFWCKGWGGSVVGAKIEYSSSSYSSSFRLLHQIKDSASVSYNTVKLNTPAKCRYMRYTASTKTVLELAELQFFNKEKLIIPVSAENNISDYQTQQINLKNCYDNNPLTYFTSQRKGSGITFDFGKNVVIDRVVYMPRNDDNFIRIGDIYELYYQAGEKGWILLGKQIAEKPYLIYDNVPKNALLYLHDVTRGREEFPFFMEDGKQIFSRDRDVAF